MAAPVTAPSEVIPAISSHFGPRSLPANWAASGIGFNGESER